MARLEAAARVDGVSLIIITDAARRDTALDLLVRGSSAQIDDPAFVRELKHWIRFNPAQATATSEGLFTKVSGNPAIPTWIGKRLIDVMFNKDTENAKYTAHLQSSSGIAVSVDDKPDHEHWVKFGRSF